MMKLQFVSLFRNTKIKSGTIIIVSITLMILAGLCTSYISATNLYKTIHTTDYSISIPNAWTTKPSVINSSKDTPMINIISSGNQIGEINILSYDSTKPIEQLFGNHVSRTIKVDKINISKVPAMKVLFAREWQTNEQLFVGYELHLYFIPNKLVTKYGQNIVYDLSLNSGDIDVQKNPQMKELSEQAAIKKIFDIAGTNEKQLDEIIKSFTLTDLLGTSAANYRCVHKDSAKPVEYSYFT